MRGAQEAPHGQVWSNEALHSLVEYRGLHDDTQGCARVQRVLDALNKGWSRSANGNGKAALAFNVSRIAVGHTPANDVRVRCGAAHVPGVWLRGGVQRVEA